MGTTDRGTAGAEGAGLPDSTMAVSVPGDVAAESGFILGYNRRCLLPRARHRISQRTLDSAAEASGTEGVAEAAAVGISGTTMAVSVPGAGSGPESIDVKKLHDSVSLMNIAPTQSVSRWMLYVAGAADSVAAEVADIVTMVDVVDDEVEDELVVSNVKSAEYADVVDASDRNVDVVDVIDVVPVVPNKRVANTKSVLDASDKGYSVCVAEQVSEEVGVDLVVVVVAVLGADDMLVAVFESLLSERVLVAVGNDTDELDESNTERDEVPLSLDEDEVLCLTGCKDDEDDRLCEDEILRIEVVDDLLRLLLLLLLDDPRLEDVLVLVLVEELVLLTSVVAVFVEECLELVFSVEDCLSLDSVLDAEDRLLERSVDLLFDFEDEEGLATGVFDFEDVLFEEVELVEVLFEVGTRAMSEETHALCSKTKADAKENKESNGNSNSRRRIFSQAREFGKLGQSVEDEFSGPRHELYPQPHLITSGLNGKSDAPRKSHY
ncbi:uncharacterized protein M437DRAFT_67229 [Aureobasidium melanogenum CBS 110374]|uniref:Uncharacterized protein n=1 Tax=Aureobasidium melanogenum (strain CBS 110374) TaxID=1043003 RepID=A0A074VKJ9_AURM1|nr:uncharacterized protein M437DRAFT_67229 [Aureobasidium melanogenum CBS 110374]KEQ61265.1 hypothetical protein M437DRAFT_67229 [Aureobasidium melanogenum CBS 110374]